MNSKCTLAIASAAVLQFCFVEPTLGGSIVKKTAVEKETSVRTKHGYQMVSDNVRLGKKAQRFELRHGECGNAREWSDCKNDRQRIERKEKKRGSIQKVGSKTWYGWSIYLAPDFPALYPAHATLGQVKVRGDNPLWFIKVSNDVSVQFQIENCRIGSLDEWRGKWTDITIFADYSSKPSENSFMIWVNGKNVCTRKDSLLTKAALKQPRLYFKYGIYDTFVSRWLNANKRKAVNAKSFKQNYKETNHAETSPAKTPFLYDWGIELPTQIVFYDEMRFGASRKAVDVRGIEKAGRRAVD